MKKQIGIIVYILIGYISIAGAVDTQFISGVMEVTLRTGPGIDHRVIAMVSSGDSLEVIERGPKWSKVRKSDGKEGYVLNRFLTSDLPCNLVLKRLKKKHEMLLEQSAEPLKEVARLTDENVQLKNDLKTTKDALKSLQAAHEALKEDSKNFLKIKTEYDQAAKDLTEQTARVNRLESEIAKLGWNQNIRWFLSGAGVLISGFLIGLFSKRRRRRSSLL
ncbi:MAG: TIGR04211 family SH3 domain-containing protein [Deltaproteobacteria bacterium]|nr:MAG: TIGR04211 family SH3 domain-containing protein [Deltaproteobacteria bacterium]